MLDVSRIHIFPLCRDKLDEKYQVRASKLHVPSGSEPWLYVLCLHLIPCIPHCILLLAGSGRGSRPGYHLPKILTKTRRRKSSRKPCRDLQDDGTAPDDSNAANQYLIASQGDRCLAQISVTATSCKGALTYDRLGASYLSSPARCLTCSGESVCPVRSSTLSLAQKYEMLNTISHTLACKTSASAHASPCRQF